MNTPELDETISDQRDRASPFTSDIEIELDTVPVRVPPGNYAAECLKITKVERREWRRSYWHFSFRLRGVGPENMAIVPGFVNLPRKGKLSALSKLGRWARIIAACTGGRETRVSMKAFGQFLFNVKVETVTKANSKDDKKPFTLPEAAQYEVVSEIIDIIGRLTTRAS
jgi:hypothetical protein